MHSSVYRMSWCSGQVVDCNILISLMPRSHIHRSPHRFHYGLNLTDEPGTANFRSQIRMHSGVATDFDVSTKDKVGKEPFGDISDSDCYGLIRSERFALIWK